VGETVFISLIFFLPNVFALFFGNQFYFYPLKENKKSPIQIVENGLFTDFCLSKMDRNC